MEFLHTMVRVADLDKSLDFYCNKLGMVEINRYVIESGRFTLVFIAAPSDESAAKEVNCPMMELTYNWDPEPEFTEGRNFGHVAFGVENIYETCQKLIDKGVVISRPPRDGTLAFVRSPDNVSIELIQKGQPLAPREPWASMPNVGNW